MRVNGYAEEMTDRIEIVEKVIGGQTFTGLRIYLELPVTIPVLDGECEIIEGGKVLTKNVQGPFIHHEGDDDSSAITFWGKADLRIVLGKAIEVLNEHYKKRNVKGEDLIRVDYKEKKVEE